MQAAQRRLLPQAGGSQQSPNAQMRRAALPSCRINLEDAMLSMSHTRRPLHIQSRFASTLPVLLFLPLLTHALSPLAHHKHFFGVCFSSTHSSLCGRCRTWHSQWEPCSLLCAVLLGPSGLIVSFVIKAMICLCDEKRGRDP